MAAEIERIRAQVQPGQNITKTPMSTNELGIVNSTVIPATQKT
jgi:hypothetical protein